MTAWKPAFVVTVGDWIEGGDDGRAEREWQELEPLRKAFPAPIYFAAGNHDIWSARSRRLYERFTRRPARYSFDQSGLHFTVLDNSGSMELAEAELDFLEQDLAKLGTAGPRFVVFHQPGWILSVLMQNPGFRLHQIAKKHKVTAVISGHTHAYFYKELDGIPYMTACSAGGHLRGKGFGDGYFYGYTQVTIKGGAVEIVSQELGPPFGQGRRVYAGK